MTIVAIPRDLGARAWELRRVLHGDPCSYCGEAPAGTVDHIIPRPLGGERTVATNGTAACSGDNTAKDTMPLLIYLLSRLDADASGTIV